MLPLVELMMVRWAAEVVAEGRCGSVYATRAMATTDGCLLVADALAE